MTRFSRSLALALLVLLVLQAGPALAKKKKTEAATDEAQGLVVSQWLVLGPAPDALPVFGEAEKGGYEMKDLLDAARFPKASWYPEQGAVEAWFGGESLQWQAVDAGEGGKVVLESNDGGRPAVAWLAVYVRTDRWREAKVELNGSHPRRLWLDGKPVASGGLSRDDDKPVEGTVKLDRGAHLLLVRTASDPEREGDWTVGAALRPKEEDGWPEGESVGAVLGIDPGRDLTILDIIDPTTVRSMALSPGGTLAAFSLRRTLPGTDETESWVEVRNARTGEPRWSWRGAGGVGNVDWVPSGQRLSFVSSGEKSTLWVADLDDGRVEPVIEGVERFGGYEWSPTGDTVVYSTSVEPEEDKSGITRLESIQDRWSYHRTKSYLHAVAIPGGAHRRLTAGADTTDFEAFSPDGKKILLTRNLEDVEARPYSRTELWEMDLATLEAKKLRDFRFGGGAGYSPDGTRLLVQAGPSAFDGAGLAVVEGTVPNDYDGQLYLWDPATDEVEAITRTFDPSVSRAEWSRADGHIYLTAEDGDYRRFYRYDVKAGSFEVLEAGPEVIEGFALATGDAGIALVRGSSVWQPQVVDVLDLDGSRTLLDPAEEWFAGVRRGIVQPWTFTASSGKTIDGRVYLPPDFDIARKYPCIVYYYGGTSPVHRGFGGRYPKEWWAAQGYVVYVLQPSGATGYGQEFSAAHVNDWGKTTSAEIIEGTKKFLESHRFVDPERVGCIGASYGGFMTMRLVTETDLFAAAVAHAGISALSSYWGEGYWGYSYSAVATADAFPWNRPDVYVDQSPLFRADKVTTPILLTHGADDTNVPRGESDQFYIALKLLGAPVEYIRVLGQDHWIMEHDKRVLWSQSIVAWFDRWLKDQPEWWNELYPE